MDVGASTGGFTDCMLQNGAVKVYSVDVGHGQLDWKLRNDERVVCMEKTNIRYVQPEDLGEPIDFHQLMFLYFADEGTSPNPQLSERERRDRCVDQATV